MAEIQNAGKAVARAYVGKAEDAKKLPGTDTGADAIKEGALRKDEFKFKKILWTPEDRARFRLSQAGSQIDRNLESIDKAIAERSQGGSWMKHFGDPALGDLRRARAELAKAKKDVAAAKQALDGSFPMWKMAQAYMGPDIWRKPQPDLAAAEARLNSALGRLAKAEHCVQSAIEQGPDDVMFYKNAKGEPGEPGEPGDPGVPGDPVEGKGGLAEQARAKCPGIWHPNSRNADLRRLLNDIRETGRGLETAREDLWEAQEKQQQPPRPWPPIHVDPPIWREPPIHKDPPIRKFPPIQIDPPIRRFPPDEKFPPIEKLPIEKLPIDRFPGPGDPVYVKGGEPEEGQT